MRRYRGIFVFMAALAPTGVFAQMSRVEALKEAPPAAISDAIKGELEPRGYRFVDDQGKTYADFWLRKAIPATGKPAGPKGAVQFPILAEGELVGALRFAEEGHDYRDQAIPKGVYTMRYGLQPVNGDHLGVSVYRDYVLLLPAAKDKALANLPRKKLEEGSSEAAGSSHPAVLILMSAPDSASKTEPSVVHDEEKATWGAVVPWRLGVSGSSGSVVLPVRIILIGAAAV